MANVWILLLSLAGLVLTGIDLRRKVIPNWLNLAIAVGGLARAAETGDARITFIASFQGATVGAVVWMLRWLYFRWRNLQGLGLGDVKLLAASGVWIGIAGVPVQLLVASLAALATAGLLKIAGYTIGRQTLLPFGPFLILGLPVTLWMEEAAGLPSMP